MKRAPLTVCLLGCLCLLPSAWAQSAGPQPIGILPVFDTWGSQAAPVVSQYLVRIVDQELREAGLRTILLNPGGDFTPLDREYLADYARAAGVQTVLVMTLPKPGGADNKLQLTVQCELWRLADNAPGPPWPSTVELKRTDLQRYEGNLAFADSRARQAVRSARAVESRDGSHSVGGGQTARNIQGLFEDWGPSRKFEKERLGKKTRQLAEQIRDSVLAQPGMAAGPPPAYAGSCAIDFHVLYAHKGQISRAYGVIINDRELSTLMKDGTVSSDVTAGAVIVTVIVNDAPYKLPVQSVYQASTYLDCGQPARTLNLEIGPAGEAFLRWR